MIKMNIEKMEDAIAAFLTALGVDTNDHNFAETPRRVAKVYAEMFGAPETETPVFDENYSDVVILKGHTFFTMCPHHLLPVKLIASICYIPNGKVIGASKLMRLMHDCNDQPMTQEFLTNKILARILELTNGGNKGAAVYMEGSHGCFSCRGVKDHGATMITFRFDGEMELTENQAMFLAQVKR